MIEEHRSRLVLLSYLLLAFAAMAVAGSKPRKSEPKLSHKELTALIGNARTPADHERLAAYYRSEARRLMSEAKEHEDLAQFYGDRTTSLEDPTYVNMGRAARHCHNIAKDYLKEAKEATALATIHEQMAKVAEKK